MYSKAIDHKKQAPIRKNVERIIVVGRSNLRLINAGWSNLRMIVVGMSNLGLINAGRRKSEEDCCRKK